MLINSIKNRTFVKILSNFSNILCNLSVVMMTTRAFGPALYGAFEFIRSFFDALISLLDLKTSNAFYSLFSKNSHDYGIVKFYFSFVGFISSILTLIILIIFNSGLSLMIWKGLSIAFVSSIALLCYLLWTKTILLKCIDAVGSTIKGEAISISINICLVLVLGYFYIENTFSFNKFILVQIIIQLVIIIFWARIILLYFKESKNINLQKHSKFNKAFKSLWSISKPLIILTIFSALILMIDRVMLQNFSGSVEQAYFSIAFRTGAIILVFCSAISTILLREFSLLIKEKNFTKIRDYYQVALPLVGILSSGIAMFISHESNIFSKILGGNAFQEAGLTIAIISFYPIMQSLAQLNISLLYASDRTMEYAKYSIYALLFGLFLTYLLLFPTKYNALELGSLGLAIKLVFVNLVLVIIFIYLNVKFLKIKFFPMILNLLKIIIVFWVLGFLSHTVSTHLINDDFYRFLLSMVIYILLASSIVFCIPRIYGLEINIFKKINNLL